MQTINELTLSKDLIKFPTVTPIDAGAIKFLSKKLKSLGFNCKILEFKKGKGKPIKNLYARLGKKQPNLCYAGHTDVVPPGDYSNWTVNPFKPQVKRGYLIGRGANDMKSSIACFVSAVSEYIKQNKNISGSISFLITGDEEALAINGTKKVVDYLKKKKERIDFCIVGEPTNPNKLGEMIKIGRRGSISGTIIISGSQGHVAYPHLADNPINSLSKMLEPIFKINLDEGNKDFEPSTAMITSIDVGNESYNIIPNKISIKFNIRFNNIHSSSSLSKMLNNHFKSTGMKYEFESFCNAEPFITNPGHLIVSLEKAIKKITNKIPLKSTNGGTSDARFIKNICPVVEFGLVGKLMHKVDEKVPVEEILKLKMIYHDFLKIFFGNKT